MTQLLERLDAELQAATDSVERAEILARKGSYLARIGRFEETRVIISELRRVFGDGRSGRATAWIMLTEGLLQLFEKLSPSALDRVARSQVLGLAMRDATIVAISSAWKAHLEFETSNFGAMVKSLQIALEHAREVDHDAQARLAMVLSEAFLICGDRVSAQAWFLHSRDHALSDGDQASIEALLYNRAAFGLARLRAERCIADIDQDQLSLVRLEIASARNLQTLTGVRALTSFVHLCDARLMIVEGKYGPAIESLEAVRSAGPFADYNFSQAFVDLELAFCLLKLNRIDESKLIYAPISNITFESFDVDEQLVAAWMRYLMCSHDDWFGSADAAKIDMQAHAVQYEQMRHRLSSDLLPFRRVNDHR